MKKKNHGNPTDPKKKEVYIGWRMGDKLETERLGYVRNHVMS